MANLPKFFSAALEAAQNLKQKRGTPQQMRSMLLQGGAKQKELDYIGVEQWLKHAEGVKDRLGPSVDDSISQDSLVRYIDQNQVKPEEVLKRGSGTDEEEVSRLHTITSSVIEDDFDTFYDEVKGDYGSKRDAREEFQSMREDVDRWKNDDPEAWRQAYDLQLGSTWDATYSNIADLFSRGESHGDTKWSQYVTGEPSERYTEHLVTLPEGHAGDDGTDLAKQYQSPHWEEPNVLAHMRYDYDPDALRLEEIQSDWLQKGREHGFKWTPEEAAAHDERIRAAGLDKESLKRSLGASQKLWTPEEMQKYVEAENYFTDLSNTKSGQRFAVPRAPLANMNDWTAMMVRRAMLEAAENDKSKLRWTSGRSQDYRYSPQAGRAKYYDEVIPSIVKKITKPYGEVKIGSEYWGGGMGSLPAGIGASADMHYAELPRPLIEALQKRGRVPFFKYGGEVE